MVLRPLDDAGIARAAGWLARPDTARWLDFGRGEQVLSPAALKVMSQRSIHRLRLFTDDGDEAPIGLVALSDIAPAFRTASLWYALGDRSRGGHGYTSRAVGALLDEAFGPLGLHAVHAWAVEANEPSVRVLLRNGFRPAGRLRQCHRLDGRPCDRLLFDLLAAEHRGA